jgi:hypothetical protein
MLMRDTMIIARDSARVTDTLPFGFVRRVAPATYAIRTEAVSDTPRAGARVTVPVVAGADSATGFSMRGFGLSDILFATRVAPRSGGQGRWRDFDIRPHAGPVSAGGTLDVLWEVYDLTARDGAASYDVAITIAQSDTRGGLGRITAEVIGTIGRVVGVDRQNNRITSRFTRTVAAGRAVADHVTISLGDTPPGVYSMTIEVTDRATGRTASRIRSIVVR